MELIHSVILGVVEGVTEFLPISSTGHLILTAKILGLTPSEFLKTFEIAIQLGAILSVVVLYWQKLLMNFNVFKRVLIAFIPTAVVGAVLYKAIKHFLQNEQVVLWSMLLGGVFLIVFELLHKEKESCIDEVEKISYQTAFWIGVFQSVAMIPGVSRAAATICGGLLLNLKRKTIVEFSFLVAVPTMLAATILDLLKHQASFSDTQWVFLLTGFLVSFGVAFASIKFLLQFIQKHSFILFGLYRIAAAIVFWLVFQA